MEFSTQRELLEYLGKNSDDRKLVQRLMAKGEVRKEWGMYIYEPQVKVKDLYNEINQLREKISQLEDNANTFNGGGDYNEAKAQWDYWEKKCRRYGKYIEQVIEVTYNRIKPMLWSKLEEKSEFREHILEEVREICGNDE